MGWRKMLNVFQAAGSARASSIAPVFEALEPRLLMSGDLPSISLIEADNRGLIVLTASADLNAGTINNTSVEVSTAGSDQIFGTGDDTLVSRTVEYVSSSRQIRITASVPADVRYRVRLNSSIITGADGRFLDGEFTGAGTISGNGTQGGDLVFFTRRASASVARFTTTSGIIDVTLFTDRTPLTVQNFLNYANRGVWDLTFIHRSVPGFVIQGGGFSAQGTNNYPRIAQDPPVMNEPGISNIRGTIAMAKLGGNPNSATNEFFFNLGNNASNLDNQNGGFTAFGEVRTSAGLQVMDALAAFQVLNAQGVNGAFNELPVIDRGAVLARPGALTVLPSDLIRINRIALLVDVSGEPAQQLDPTGSVVIMNNGNDAGPMLQAYDLDQTGLGDLSQAIQVRFGRNGAISSITIRDGLPASRIGLVITNATSVGSIVDARRTDSGNIAFILSTAPVGSATINGTITGFDLNGFAITGVSLEDDLDGDGLTNDPVALLFPDEFVSNLRIMGDVNGDVIAPGGFGIVTVTGNVTNADFVSTALSTPRAPTFTFRSVTDSEIRVGVGIASIRADEWRDTGGRAERIVAPSLDSLRIGGNFEAGLNLNRNINPRPTLGTARIDGDVFGSAWVVQGAIGSLTVRGNLTDWSLISATNSGAISLGRVNNSAVAFSGRVARLTAVDWQGGSFVAAVVPTVTISGNTRQGVAGDFIGTLAVNGGGTTPVINTLSINGMLIDGQINITGSAGRFIVKGGLLRTTIRVTSGDLRGLDTGTIVNSTVNVQRTLTTISAISYENASLQGGAYDTIIARGDARSGNAGNFQGEIRPSAINRLDVKGDFTGTLNVRNAGNVNIGGNVTSAIISFTITPNPTQLAFQVFRVGGSLISTDFRIVGRAGHVFADAMIESGIYVGAPAGTIGLPGSGTGFRPDSRIEEVTLTGAGDGQPAFVNSFIVASTLNTVRIKSASADNFGRVYGVAAGSIKLVEAKVSGTTLRVGANDPTPSPIGDFNVFVNFTPPPGVVV